jgi:ubiquinone/menaquinone biosynthesis C-methylase UbiE
VQTLLRELTTIRPPARVPEPRQVVDDLVDVDEYVRAAQSDRALAPVRVLVAALASEIIRPGQTVLDLGCGPGRELGVLAKLYPETRFIGVDLSAPMLRAGERLLAGANNVELRQSDISRLHEIETSSIDVVISTFALHHLPDRAALASAFRSVRRVLRPRGGACLFDLARLRSARSVDDLARRYARERSALFTTDYWHSMRAAFSVREMQVAARELPPGFRVHATFLVPYMLLVQRKPDADSWGERAANGLTSRSLSELAKMCADLDQEQLADLDALLALFRLGGVRAPSFRGKKGMS